MGPNKNIQLVTKPGGFETSQGSLVLNVDRASSSPRTNPSDDSSCTSLRSTSNGRRTGYATNRLLDVADSPWNPKLGPRAPQLVRA